METRLPSNYCWTFFCVIVCCHFSVTSASRFTTVGRPKGTIFYEANHSAELRERPSASIALALCMNQLEFSTKQRRMCLKFPKQFTSVLRGFREALDECRHQFRHNRWNCSSFSSMRGSVMLAMTRAFMKRGFKEVAFVHALIAASIARTVSLDCLMGGIPSCNRRGSKRRRTKAEYSRHNKAISHGIYISEKFLNSHKKSRDTPEMVKRKNYRVGRMVCWKESLLLQIKCTFT
ncbi:protein Wnt-2b-like isoform X2 [Xenia sp. Carnegie-2017]|uniref:protein Wnt-2b-like isoform X2 n=1 Tax=Xenia sp. Carnegie-2017 TaxID=2897299 RepID=UPI001F0397FF|nr:protein Wnt-2b-like isoform X2 [Xenia sp. Carnegie-2017]